MSQGLWSIGSELQVNFNRITPNFEHFPEVISMNWKRGTRDKIDLTNHDSPPPFEEFVFGIAHGAQIDISYNLIPGNTVQQELEDEWIADQTDGPFDVRIIYNDTALTTYTFEAYLSDYGTTHDSKDAHRGTATISCTGQWTRSTGGS